MKRSKKVKELETFLNGPEEVGSPENDANALNQNVPIIEKANESENGDSGAGANEAVIGEHESALTATQTAPIKMRRNLWSLFFKRFFDIIISLLALIILSPVMLIVAVLIRIKLGGPVIFSQYRPGKNNKVFKLYKFRTMSNKTDKDGNLLPDAERMTKFGNALRKTSLDELPQLINILKGDMSIIGPRPKLVRDMVFYNEDQNVRALVRPGLTGLAQVNGRNNATWEEIFEYDKTYVQKIGFWTDFKIFFKTIGKVIGKKDIVEQNQAKQNYYFGDYLLETNQISFDDYMAHQREAEDIIKQASGK